MSQRVLRKFFLATMKNITGLSWFSIIAEITCFFSKAAASCCYDTENLYQTYFKTPGFFCFRNLSAYCQLISHFLVSECSGYRELSLRERGRCGEVHHITRTAAVLTIFIAS